MNSQAFELAIHLVVTFGIAAFFAVASVTAFCFAVMRPMPGMGRVLTVLYGIGLLGISVGCLSGVGLGPFDRYWDLHRPPLSWAGFLTQPRFRPAIISATSTPWVLYGKFNMTKRGRLAVGSFSAACAIAILSVVWFAPNYDSAMCGFACIAFLLLFCVACVRGHAGSIAAVVLGSAIVLGTLAAAVCEIRQLHPPVLHLTYIVMDLFLGAMGFVLCRALAVAFAAEGKSPKTTRPRVRSRFTFVVDSCDQPNRIASSAPSDFAEIVCRRVADQLRARAFDVNPEIGKEDSSLFVYFKNHSQGYYFVLDCAETTKGNWSGRIERPTLYGRRDEMDSMIAAHVQSALRTISGVENISWSLADDVDPGNECPGACGPMLVGGQ